MDIDVKTYARWRAFSRIGDYARIRALGILFASLLGNNKPMPWLGLVGSTLTVLLGPTGARTAHRGNQVRVIIACNAVFGLLSLAFCVIAFLGVLDGRGWVLAMLVSTAIRSSFGIFADPSDTVLMRRASGTSKERDQANGETVRWSGLARVAVLFSMAAMVECLGRTHTRGWYPVVALAFLFDSFSFFGIVWYLSRHQETKQKEPESDSITAPAASSKTTSIADAVRQWRMGYQIACKDRGVIWLLMLQLSLSIFVFGQMMFLIPHMKIALDLRDSQMMFIFAVIGAGGFLTAGRVETSAAGLWICTTATIVLHLCIASLHSLWLLGIAGFLLGLAVAPLLKMFENLIQGVRNSGYVTALSQVLSGIVANVALLGLQYFIDCGVCSYAEMMVSSGIAALIAGSIIYCFGRNSLAATVAQATDTS